MKKSTNERLNRVRCRNSVDGDILKKEAFKIKRLQ
jgi:hypothetical protein